MPWCAQRLARLGHSLPNVNLPEEGYFFIQLPSIIETLLKYCFNARLSSTTLAQHLPLQ